MAGWEFIAQRQHPGGDKGANIASAPRRIPLAVIALRDGRLVMTIFSLEAEVEQMLNQISILVVGVAMV